MNHAELLRLIAQAAAEGWTALDLSNKGLTELPPEIGTLVNLEDLNLGRNQISKLPTELRKLTRLRHLDLVSNQFREFPNEIIALSNLTQLYLSANRLTALPPEIGKLTKLKILFLNANQLIMIPPEIGKLTNLNYLNLNANQLINLPIEIEKLSNLISLRLKGNPLPIPYKIMESIDEPDQIITYYLHHHAIQNETTDSQKWYALSRGIEIQQILENAAQNNVEFLDLSHKELTRLPYEIGELTDLTELDLSYNHLTTLPKEIKKLTKLIRLDLRYNQFTIFPSEIENLTNLNILHLGDNQLTTIPANIKNLTNLKSFKIWRNQLITLPPEISKLKNLIELNLANNQLTTFPKEIGELTNLEKLSLSGSNLTILPIEIKQLTNLKRLNLTGNPLPIPPEILALKEEPAKILNYYFQHQAQQKKPLNEAKVLIVGQGAVGKTSLIKRLLEDTFNPHEIKTDGIAIKHWHIPVPSTLRQAQDRRSSGQAQIRLNVWDFGGQEIMHATHQFFLTKRSLYLLVLDSRLDEKENRVEYWLKIVQSFGGDSPVIVVCNKSDQHDLELDWRGLQTKYPQIHAFAKQVSCKTGDGIAALRELIGQKAGQLEHIHDELILPWFAVKTQLEEMQRDYIAYGDYQQMCLAENVADDLSQQTLLGFLHDLGIVLHFHDHPILEDTNVLNPEWVTRGVYQILNSNELFQCKGELARAALDRILDPQNYPRNKHQFILDMMRKFELCFDFAEQADTRFLVPDLLSKEEPYTGEWDDSLGFQYHYDILPGSVISRFIVRMHTYIHQKTYWRNGVVLASEDGKNRALVKADAEDKKIFIAVTGRADTRQMLLALIRADFRKIHATIPKLAVKEKVPIPGHPQIVVDYEHLRNLEELGEASFIPEGLKIKVHVKQLLHGIAGSAGISEKTPGVSENSGSFRIRQQLAELRQQWDWLSEKLARLGREIILETRVDEKLRLENQIAELTAERERIAQRLHAFERNT